MIFLQHACSMFRDLCTKTYLGSNFIEFLVLATFPSASQYYLAESLSLLVAETRTVTWIRQCLVMLWTTAAVEAPISVQTIQPGDNKSSGKDSREEIHLPYPIFYERKSSTFIPNQKVYFFWQKIFTQIQKHMPTKQQKVIQSVITH